MADIGSTLRETRMRARIDISEVEARTKIRAKYLRAIENEEWDLLPGPVFIKSFLKTYGDYLGVDSRPLIDEFKRRYESPGDHDPRPIAAQTRERERASQKRRVPLLPPAALIVLVLVVVVGVLYLIGHGGSNNGREIGSAPNVSRPGSGQGHGQHHRQTGNGAHGGGNGRHNGNGGRHGGGAGNGTHTRTHPHPPPPPPKVATLALANVTAPVWVCVENASGKALIDGVTFSPGDTIHPVRAGTLLVNLGNNNVQAKVNGKPYALTSASAIGLKITPTGVASLTEAPTCG